MKNIFLFFLSFACISINAQTIEIKGSIKDSTYAIPYASVYIKSNPKTGIMAGSDGTFSLNVEKNMLPDTLVISFVGYKTYYTPIDTNVVDSLHVLMEEDIINLAEVSITSGKNVPKKSRSEMGELLKMVKEQFLRDIENNEARYHTLSKTSVASSDQILVYQESLADIYEEDWKKKDMTQVLDIKAYINPRVENYVENELSDTATQKKLGLLDEKEDEDDNDGDDDEIKEIDPSTNIKGLTVTSAMIEEMLDHDTKNWEFTAQTDTHYVLTMKYKLGFLGIIKYRQTGVLYIDRLTYSITKADNSFYVYVNIPFGKKLPDEFVGLINMINITSDKPLSKFRLKKLTADFTMTSDFIHKNGTIYRGDSYSHGNAIISSRQATLDITLKSTQDILSIETESPTPITEEETKIEPSVEIIKNM